MNNRPTTDLFKDKSIGDLIAEGLEEFADVLKKNKKSVAEKFTCHKVLLDLVPTAYSPALVKETRKILNASQAVFAKFLGVSPNAVRAWEQGVNPPQDSSRRFMDEIRHDPDHFRARMKELIVKKTMRRPKKGEACEC